jgi:thiamine biosynthesis lipoprotein
MGTRVEVQLWHDDDGAAAQLISDAMAELDRIEDSMSTYRFDSEITHINNTAAEKPVIVGAELFDLIARALQLSVKTNGAFDITYDGVGQLYDYRSNARPSQAEIERRMPTMNYRHVQLNQETSQIRYTQPGVRINLGGIAKGYAVESVIALLRKAGVQHAMASDEAVSTSGDYERFFIEDGVRYHHIINPATGKSAGDVRSVTVIGPDATMTDGLSTSVFVLGPTAGLALIESLEGYETVIVDKEYRVVFSTGLDPR